MMGTADPGGEVIMVGRYKRVDVSLNFLAAMMHTGARSDNPSLPQPPLPLYDRCVAGLPPEARWVGAYIHGNTLYLIYEHPEWPEVEQGTLVPLLQLPTFERVYREGEGGVP